LIDKRIIITALLAQHVKIVIIKICGLLGPTIKCIQYNKNNNYGPFGPTGKNSLAQPIIIIPI